MLSEILAVFFVTLCSSLFLSTTCVHGLPKSSSTTHHYNRLHPSADSSSSLRLLRRHPIPSIDYDLGGDISQMLIGESNELPSTMNDHDDDSSFLASSLDAIHEPSDFYRQPSSSKSSLSRKLLLLLNKQHQQKQEEEDENEDEDEKQNKRSSISSNNKPSSLMAQFNLNSALATGGHADPLHTNSDPNHSQSNDATRLSPGLKLLIEKNPLARIWISLLIQKLSEEQSVPYIFKYGRRRKK
ncbi:unnamed protein product [Rotaria magnacalcarata]|uniref:Uncharacterized protein n=1 Tax=Rotaria magnacalcarata TaxID=392030 RepID=A0A816UK36_9BILA|nr:unnamed protein product [Rotaria magnacalcarata]CAF2112184.1 unnamed protein product [Rotaria magnacalcarata]CAF3776312.1 unnamed protein product [Rotaria magnacalcarata]CAF4011668.1 unnamed protein product [Rotaria magnacalcarata]